MSDFNNCFGRRSEEVTRNGHVAELRRPPEPPPDRCCLQLRHLSVDDVLFIYDVLVNDFAADNDPIAPAGVRSRHLLESALSRQTTSIGGVLKYPDPIRNAATLAYGICSDHPFHNGNKRTALVAMLVHLDRNKLCLYDTTQEELYQVMLALADHRLGLRAPRRHRNGLTERGSPDHQVNALGDWLKKRVERLRRGERQLTPKQLRRALERYGYALQNAHGGLIDIVKMEQKTRGPFWRRQVVVEPKRVGTMGYRDEGTFLSIKDIKRVRKNCRLREEDGVDSESFYDTGEIVDAFINRYRTTLRRLART